MRDHTVTVAWLAGILLMCGCESKSSSDPTDLVRYCQEARSSGMSERAHDSLSMIAKLEVRTIILTAQRDPTTSTYFWNYLNTACPSSSPSVGQVESWNAQQVARENEVVALLKRAADSDDSGFVSSEEGNKFRATLELGLRAALILEDCPNCTRDQLASALGVTAEDLTEKLAVYDTVRSRAPKGALSTFSSVPIDLHR